MQTEHKGLKKPIALLLGMIIGLLVLLFIWQYVRKDMAQQFSKTSVNQVVSVEIGAVTAEVWHPQVSAIGSIRAIQGTNISAEITGKVSKIFFVSGQMVNAGDQLVQLDDTSLRADVAQARAAYAAAQLNLQRITSVYRKQAVSKQSYDEAVTQLQEDQAALAKANALLNQATITAPFAGKLGLRNVSLGQYVAAGYAMVSLQQLDPVDIDFDLPEEFISLVRAGDQVQLVTSTYSNKTFTGKVLATGAVLNAATRTLNVRAEVPNPTHDLVPGMFANVNVIIPQDENVLTVPEMAVNYSPFGDAIFKVTNDKVQQVYVKVGEQRGSMVSISGNVHAGDLIVTTGVFKLQDNSIIKIVNPPRVKADKRPGTTAVPKIQRVPVTVNPAPAKTNSTLQTTTNIQQHMPVQDYKNKSKPQDSK